MSWFKRKDKKPMPEDWLQNIENYANYFGDLKLDIESLVNEVITSGNYEVAYHLWDEKWGDYEQGCAFFFVLGVLEGVADEIRNMGNERE